MSRPPGIKETFTRKRMVGRGSTDGESYGHFDSGCRVATLHLGHASLCFECPFSKCVKDGGRGK